MCESSTYEAQRKIINKKLRENDKVRQNFFEQKKEEG